MVGRAIARSLEQAGYHHIIGKTSKELDLRNQKEVQDFFYAEKPEIVIDAAAKVGGILANKNFPYQFLMENLQIQNNLIDSANKYDVKKFIFLGSSCIYPKRAPQPLKEEYLLTDTLEPSNEGYAIAKICGVKVCEAIRKEFGKDFISLMPTNLYGPFDNFDLETSHVLAAMIRKFENAKNNGNFAVTLWGSGKPYREFMYVDDLADAVKFVLENEMGEALYNVGTGNDLTIKKLAVGHTGEIIWDDSKPDGTPRKWMDVSKLKNKGWSYSVALEEGIRKTYEWYINNKKEY